MRIKIKPTGDGGYVATLCLGLDSPVIGDIDVSAEGDSKAEALEKAALVAERITSDPVFMTMMPPQVTLAVLAAKMLGRAAGIGMPELRAMFGTLKGKGQRRLARSLARETADNGNKPEVGARRMPPPRAAPQFNADRGNIRDQRKERVIVTEDGRKMGRGAFRAEEAKKAGGFYVDPRMLRAADGMPADYMSHERSTEVHMPDPLPPPDPYGQNPYGQPQPGQPFNPYAPQQPGYPPGYPQQPYAQPWGNYPPGVSPFQPGYQPPPQSWGAQPGWDPWNPAYYPAHNAPDTSWWQNPQTYDWYGAETSPDGFAQGYGYMDPSFGYDGGYGYGEEPDNGGDYEGGTPAEVRDHRTH